MRKREDINYPTAQIDSIEPDKKREIVNDLLNLHSMGKPETDADVKERIEKYFEYCKISGLRPCVESMAIALGVSRQTLWRWRTGVNCSRERQEMISNALTTIAAYITQAMLQGQVNVVCGIFLLKNWFSYLDSTPDVIEDNGQHMPGRSRADLLGIEDAVPEENAEPDF